MSRDKIKGVDTGGGPGKEYELELTSLLLSEQEAQGEEATESTEKITRAKGMDAGL